MGQGLRFAVLLASATAAPAAAADLAIRVIDPHGAPVRAAQITIRCPHASSTPQIGPTYRNGVFAAPQQVGCELTVDAAGFALWQGALDDVRNSGVVRLAIESIEERIEVRATALQVPWSPLSSAHVAGDALRLVGQDAALALRYAKARAGTTLREDRIYVDGLPAAHLPPASTIDTISINPDPFSVLYSEADQNIVDVVSTTPDRQFWWNGGLVPRKIGGRNPLAPDMTGERRILDLSVGGPVPWTPITFSADVNRTTTLDEKPVFSAFTGDPERAWSYSRARSLAIGLVGNWRPGFRTRASILSIRGEDDGVGVGGVVQPEAGMRGAVANDEARLVMDASHGEYRYRTGLSYADTDASFRASSNDVGLVVLEAITSGGAPTQMMRSMRRSWFWNSTITPTDSSWLVGWSLGSERNHEHVESNPNGQLLFGSLTEYEAARHGLGGGTWSLATGSVRQTLRSTTWVMYGQKEWRRSPTAVLRAGARVDYQSGDGVAVSPRLSGHATVRGVELQSGIGLFRHNWSNDILMQAQRFDAEEPQWFVSDVPFTAQRGDAPVHRIRTVLAANFTRPRSIVVRNSLTLRRSRASAGVEHTWTTGLNRPASRRVRSGDGWIDQLESSRTLRRHQLHVRGELAIGSGSLVAHYEWVLSHDNGSGPFSFLEFPGRPDREWARSAGVAPQNVSLVASLPTMRGINAGLIFTARSRTPLDVRTGLDPQGLRLYIDRGDRGRNSGCGPAYQSLDAFANRRVAIPFLTVRQLFVDVSLAAENLLGSANYETVGAVLASPLYGRPVAAQPGRSVRVSFRISQ